MEKLLLNDLLMKTNKYTRPTTDPHLPTVVTLDFGLRKVGSLVSNYYVKFVIATNDHQTTLF